MSRYGTEGSICSYSKSLTLAWTGGIRRSTINCYDARYPFPLRTFVYNIAPYRMPLDFGRSVTVDGRILSRAEIMVEV